jgi:hypothetical protein
MGKGTDDSAISISAKMYVLPQHGMGMGCHHSVTNESIWLLANAHADNRAEVKFVNHHFPWSRAN